MWSFAKLPSDPPPSLAFFQKKKLPPFFLLKIASLMAETNFTFGPTSNTNIFPLSIVIICPELAKIRYTQVQQKMRDEKKELINVIICEACHCSCFPHGKDPLLFQRRAALVPVPQPQPRATSWTSPPSLASFPGSPQGVGRPC